MSVRRRVFGLLQRHGWNATSFQVLKPGFRYWLAPDGGAAVAYVDTGAWWMAAGAPICAPERLAEAAGQFAVAAREAGRRAAFFGAVERLLAAAPPSYDHLQVGSQAVWDPRRWEETTASSSIPSQVRRAERKGVDVRSVPPADLRSGQPLRQEAEALIRSWQARHGMPPMRYLVDVAPFLCREERRYFGAFLEDRPEPPEAPAEPLTDVPIRSADPRKHQDEKSHADARSGAPGRTSKGRLVALLVAVPIYARGGWFLESLLFDAPVPNGTTEALIDRAMRTLGAEGAGYATMGLSALARLPGRPGRHVGLTALLRFCYRKLSSLYNFQGVERFQERLRPHDWEPVYLVAHGGVTPGTIWAVLKAFAGGRLDRFAAWTLRRRLKAVPLERWAGGADLLAALLIPWIGVLLLCDSARWFGADWLAPAWASFDAAVSAGFFALGRGLRRKAPWVRPLARTLLGVVLADAWLTLAQAVLHNAPRTSGWEWGVLAAACSAPPLAAAFLGGVLARSR